MTYTVSCLMSLYGPALLPMLESLPVDFVSYRADAGFAYVTIECDAATAAVIAKRYYVSEI